jgi:ergothioneine biosynthesis protein EgtB
MEGSMHGTRYRDPAPAHFNEGRGSMQVLYWAVRGETLKRAAPLSPEDQCLQSMPDASPTKWHLAHTTWFFEAMLLRPYLQGYIPFDERNFYLFNSYYDAMGARLPRAQRGLVSRPSLDEVYAYRRHVDKNMEQLMEQCDSHLWQVLRPLVMLGLNHEQQHQELLQTDIVHALWRNPFRPAYQTGVDEHDQETPDAPPSEWVEFPGGLASVGYEADGTDLFAFDNEMPRHDTLLQPYCLGSRLVSCGEYAEFIADGGYLKPQLWLSDGWATVQDQGWRAPIYWSIPEDASSTQDWQVYGLLGSRPFVASDPVINLSFYEAAAYAEWAGARLPTEFEWEAASGDTRLSQTLGHAWQWTRSSYDPYPGFHPTPGATAEYNGKFMVGQMVLRGSSLATPSGHARNTYRNFFPPAARWQFAGLRLAKDCTQ